MAVDTKQKRFSATMLTMPGYTPGVVPTGTIGQALRQAVVLVYSGILAGAVSIFDKVVVAFSDTAMSIALSDSAPGIALTDAYPGIEFSD